MITETKPMSRIAVITVILSQTITAVHNKNKQRGTTIVPNMECSGPQAGLLSGVPCDVWIVPANTARPFAVMLKDTNTGQVNEIRHFTPSGFESLVSAKTLEYICKETAKWNH